jgi:hypothetical protein
VRTESQLRVYHRKMASLDEISETAYATTMSFEKRV